MVADLDLLRAEHAEAARGYREALRLDPHHVQARVNLGLTLLRWERSRTHHDPACSDVLRVTPKRVLAGEFPGQHQRRW